MIDWEATLKEYGYSSLPSRNRPKVICICDKCKKAQSIIIRTKSKLYNNQLKWLCHSCICNNEEFKDKIKTSTNKLEYKEKRAALSKAIWANPKYKKKVIDALKAKYSDDKYKEKMQAIWHSEEFIKKASLKSKITTKILWTNQEYREKMSIAMSSPEYKEKMATIRAAQSGSISSIQSKLYIYLDELGIEYHKEGEQTRIGYYVFDCLVTNGDKKILIECQGDYWHSLPKHKRNDRSKFTYISKYFPEYEIMYVWEHEFYCKNRVLDRLKLKLGINIETKEFNFSDLVLKPINFSETKTFLDLYHYLGKDRGGKAFGAFHNDLLIAAIVFSPPLRQNTAGQFNLVDGEVRELSRLCIHPSYHKKNFASWFIKRALKQIDCKLVVAYADTTVGHTGGIYKASNFKLHHIVPADYWYVDTSGYVMHKRTLYGRARSLKLTESEFAEKYSYVRKYGGEKLCFIAFLDNLQRIRQI